MTSEHDSVLVSATSLLGASEVCAVKTVQPPREFTDARRVLIRMVDDRMSGKEGRREDGRSVETRPPYDRLVGCSAEVRATIVARKRGNACGVKGGRKVNVQPK